MEREARWSLRCVWSALALWALVVLVLPRIFGPVFFATRGGRPGVPELFALVQLALWSLAAGWRARSRGYSWALALAGILGPVGWLAVVLLPPAAPRADLAGR